MKNASISLPSGACWSVIVAVLWLPAAISHAQQISGPTCSSTPQHQHLLNAKSQKQLFETARKRLSAYMASSKTYRTNAEETIYTIPVVVHILEPQDRSLLTDQQVHEGIAELNKAFRNQLPESDGVDTRIQFQLAVRSPQCTPTSGINRVYPNNPAYTNFGVTSPSGAGLPYDQVYPMSYWNNLEYYNIWVINFMDQGSAFASYPTGAFSPYDGTMITASYFNTKILPHELGHGMFLGHTFARGIGGGDLDAIECPPNDNCAEQGDNICDTEPVNQSSNFICYGIANPPNPCYGNSPYGNVLKNYMGYNTFSCQTQFTNDQRTRMRSAIETLRSGLINSKGLDPVVVAQTIQKGTSATLNATNCNGLIQWYDAPANGSHLGSGSSYTTPILEESRTYYVSCLRADCPSDVRVPAIVNVGALPVTLVRFGAELLEQNQVVLRWATSFETMHDHFDVESAHDAKTFRTVGQVWAPARKAGGISEYQFTDIPGQPANVVYYRLKQVDRATGNANASFAYSKIVHVRMPDTREVTISPNPAEHSITINVTSQNWNIEISNAAGTIVHSAKNQRHIDSKRFPAGLYLMRVTTENGYTISKKIIKK